MQLHRAKKIEIICEHAILEQVIAAIEEGGGHGYTVLPSLQGRGESGNARQALFDESLNNVMILVVANPGIAEAIIELVYPLLEQYSGIMHQVEVDVIRPNRF